MMLSCRFIKVLIDLQSELSWLWTTMKILNSVDIYTASFIFEEIYSSLLHDEIDASVESKSK